MQSFPFELEYYVTEKGEMPFKEWLDGLRDIHARARIRVRLDRVRLGNLGIHHPVDDGVHELVEDFGPGYRVYFAREGSVLFCFCWVEIREVRKEILQEQRNSG